MPANISPLVRLWSRAVAVVGGAVVAVWFVMIPLGKWTGHQHARIRELQMRLADTQQFQQTAVERKQVLAQTRKQVEALQLQLSRGQGMAHILDRLCTDAERWHVDMNATQSADHAVAQPVQWGPHLSLQATPITLTLIGRYRAIGEFLAGFTHAPFAAEVQRVSLKRHPERHPQLEAHVTLLVYGTTTSLATP